MRDRRTTERGTSLIEALAALTVTALTVATVTPFVTQILTRWTTGQSLAEAADQLTRASIRLQQEVSTIEWLARPPGDGKPETAVFRGDSRGFIVPHASRDDRGRLRLELLSLRLEDSADGTTLIRRTGDYDSGSNVLDPLELKFPNALISGGWKMQFSYVAANGARQPEWHDRPDLPARIDLTIAPTRPGLAPAAPISLVLGPRGKSEQK